MTIGQNELNSPPFEINPVPFKAEGTILTNANYRSDDLAKHETLLLHLFIAGGPVYPKRATINIKTLHLMHNYVTYCVKEII